MKKIFEMYEVAKAEYETAKAAVERFENEYMSRNGGTEALFGLLLPESESEIAANEKFERLVKIRSAAHTRLFDIIDKHRDAIVNAVLAQR